MYISWNVFQGMLTLDIIDKGVITWIMSTICHELVFALDIWGVCCMGIDIIHIIHIKDYIKFYYNIANGL